MGETYNGWTTKFLQALGAPANKENLACIYAVIDGEGTQYHWNPLAIDGGTLGNSSGVGNFPDEKTGIMETVNFLNTQGANNYPGLIVKPLQTGDGATAIQGIDKSGAWGSSKNDLVTYAQLMNGQRNIDTVGKLLLPSDPNPGASAEGAVKGDVGSVLGVNVPDPLAGLAAIGHFFSVLSTGSTWVRVGEVLGGVIILAFAIGIMRNDIYTTGRQGMDIAKSVTKIGAAALL